MLIAEAGEEPVRVSACSGDVTNRMARLRSLIPCPSFLAVAHLRERGRRSLAWRLAVSHLVTVLVTIVSVFAILWLIAAGLTIAIDPARREPADDARAVARVLDTTIDRSTLDTEAGRGTVVSILGALARRELKLDRDISAVSFDVASPRRLEHVRSVSLVGPSGAILISSDPDLAGRPIEDVSPGAGPVVQHALAGSRDPEQNSAIARHGASAAVGSYPLNDGVGDPLVVLIDKAALSNPNSWATAKRPFVDLLVTVGVFLLTVIIPATVVAALIGIPRARAISRPVGDLSDAARALARGDLGRRVGVQGEDEVAALGTAFNEMAARLQETLSQEAAERSRAEERTRELAALLDIARAVTSTLELQPLLAVILDQLRSVVDYTGAAVMTLESDALTILDSRSTAGGVSERGLRFPIEPNSPLWRPITAEETVTIDDVRGDTPLAIAYRETLGERFNAPPFSLIRSWLGVPLAVKGRVIGALSVSRREPGAFSDAHARLVRAVADQAALAIENARLYHQAAELASLEERTRLARDLHDSVTQSIFSVAMMTRAAQVQLERGLPDVPETLRTIAAVAGDALAEMRALILELRPATLDQEGLDPALRGLVESLQTRTDARVTYAGGSAARLAPATEMALFRIAQESLGNAIKHARATTLAVHLDEGDGVLRITVADDGAGFEPDAAATAATDGARGGMGLRSMRERALAAGIALRIDSTPGAGTRITAEAPLPAPPPAPPERGEATVGAR